MDNEILTNAELGGRALGSLMKVLEADFTEEQANTLTTLVLYSIVFQDAIKEYWETFHADFFERLVENIKDTEGDIKSD